MTKKQFGIIFTLLALILCVGVLAAKLNNGGLNDPNDLVTLMPDNTNQNIDGLTPASSTDSNSKAETEVLNQKDYFYDSRSSKDQQDSATIQTLKDIIADSNTSQEKKDEATKELTQKTVTRDNENRIEVSIKNKGYEDALCTLSANKATVIVKSPAGLEEKDSIAIQEIVQDISNIKDVIIEVQK